MEPLSERLQYLLDRYTKGLISEEETRELFSLLKDHDPGGAVQNKIKDLWNNYKGADPLPSTDWENMYQSIVATPVMRRKRFAWRQSAVAIALLLLIGSGVFYWIKRNDKQQSSFAKDQPAAPLNDALPGQNKATLTLAGGQVIVLDSAAPGKLTNQGGMVVLNQGSGITYSGNQNIQEVVYNTLTTHRGEQYALTLADGTKAWLNAASSIKYPVAFTGSEREVEITGEVYFEVAHNPNQPFRVKKPGSGMAVQVLGTHFNVNAYDDEEAIKVTLLEGSVKVKLEAGSKKYELGGKNPEVVIKPGQQAILTADFLLQTSDNPDLEAVMSWKNGYFSFNHTDLPTMLRQLSRWYDVEVVFETSIPEMKIGGGITRNSNLSQVLKILEELKVKFEVQGKKLIVRK